MPNPPCGKWRRSEQGIRKTICSEEAVIVNIDKSASISLCVRKGGSILCVGIDISEATHLRKTLERVEAAAKKLQATTDIQQ